MRLLYLLVSVNCCWQGALLKWGPRSTLGWRGGWLTMVVPLPSALSSTVKLTPWEMTMVSLSVNLECVRGVSVTVCGMCEGVCVRGAL